MKFGKSLYEELSKDSKILQTYVDTTFDNRYAAEIWKQYFVWDSLPSPDDMFKSIEVVDDGVIMADVRARYSEVNERANGGFNYYFGSVPDLSHGFGWTNADVTKFKRLMESTNNSTAIVEQLTAQLDKYIRGVHARISYMAMQLLSSGKITVEAKDGIGYKSEAPIPAGNFKFASTAVWSDNANATVFDDMIAAQNYVKDDLGYTGALEWTVSKEVMQNILKNEQVQSWVHPVVLANGLAVSPSGLITEKQLNDFLTEYQGIYPIRVVDSASREQSYDGSVSTVKGWANGVAVLRPAGLAGTIKWSTLPELDNVSNESGITVAYLEGGRIGIKRKFSTDKETWKTSVLCAATPALDKWNYHVILQTLSLN